MPCRPGAIPTDRGTRLRCVAVPWQISCTVTALGGADIAWLAGGAGDGPLYYPPHYPVARPRKIPSATAPKITAAVAS